MSARNAPLYEKPAVSAPRALHQCPQVRNATRVVGRAMVGLQVVALVKAVVVVIAVQLAIDDGVALDGHVDVRSNCSRQRRSCQ